MTDPTFTNVSRQFVLSFENKYDRTYFSKYYLPKFEIKYFNVLIDGKPFFEISIKNKEKTYEAVMGMMNKNDIYTTGNLLDCENFSKHYRIIAIDLSKQIELENPDLKQHINSIGRLGENNVSMFFIIEKKEETTFNNKEKTYKAVMGMMNKNNIYTTGNLLDCENFSKHYRIIAIDLSKQIELENPDLKQQINSIGRLGQNNVSMFFIIEKKEKTIFDFSQNSGTVL